MASLTEALSIIDEYAIKSVAERAFGPGVQVQNAKLDRYSAKRVGLMGEHAALEIRIARSADSSQIPCRNFFVKILYMRNAAEREHLAESGMFEREMSVYTQLLPEIRRHIDFPAFTSEFYFGSSDLLILEDSRVRGFSTRANRILGLEDFQSAARALARLHASSLLASRRFGSPLDVLYPDCFTTNCLANLEKDLKMHRVLLDLVRRLTGSEEIDCDRLVRGFRMTEDYTNRKNGPQHVVCHGDAHTLNFMFDQSNPANCILVDFAMVNWSDQIVDLLQFIYLNSNYGSRAQFEERTIEAYHLEFTRIIRENDTQINIRSLEELSLEYNRHRIIGTVSGLFYCPMYIVEKVQQDYGGILEAINKILIRKNNDLIFEHIKQDPGFEYIISNLAMEFVECCEKAEFFKEDHEI